MKRSPQDLTEMAAAIGNHEAAARWWLDEGFSPGDAAAYVAAGCFDVPRTTELREAGISTLDIARTGLAWEFCSGTLTLTEIRSAIAPVLEQEGGLLWESACFSADHEPASQQQLTPRWQAHTGGEKSIQHTAS